MLAPKTPTSFKTPRASEKKEQESINGINIKQEVITPRRSVRRAILDKKLDVPPQNEIEVAEVKNDVKEVSEEVEVKKSSKIKRKKTITKKENVDENQGEENQENHTIPAPTPNSEVKRKILKKSKIRRMAHRFDKITPEESAIPEQDETIKVPEPIIESNAKEVIEKVETLVVETESIISDPVSVVVEKSEEVIEEAEAESNIPVPIVEKSDTLVTEIESIVSEPVIENIKALITETEPLIDDETFELNVSASLSDTFTMETDLPNEFLNETVNVVDSEPSVLTETSTNENDKKIDESQIAEVSTSVTDVPVATLDDNTKMDVDSSVVKESDAPDSSTDNIQLEKSIVSDAEAATVTIEETNKISVVTESLNEKTHLESSIVETSEVTSVAIEETNEVLVPQESLNEKIQLKSSIVETSEAILVTVEEKNEVLVVAESSNEKIQLENSIVETSEATTVAIEEKNDISKTQELSELTPIESETSVLNLTETLENESPLKEDPLVSKADDEEPETSEDTDEVKFIPIKTKISLVDLTDSPASITTLPEVEEPTSSNEIINLNESSLMELPESPKESTDTPTRQLNETFSPEPSESNKTEENKSTPPKVTERPHSIHTPHVNKRIGSINKTPVRSLNFVQKNISSISKASATKPKCYTETVSKIFKKETGTPSKATQILRETILSATKSRQTLKVSDTSILIKSIRKRSLSVADDSIVKKRNRVTFHSPLNVEMTLDDIDEQIQRDSSRVGLSGFGIGGGSRRKRSLSNIETDNDMRVTLDQIDSESKENTPRKKKSKTNNLRTKLPDFASIHQQQFKRMESIVEHAARKADRAKNLSDKKGTNPNPIEHSKDINSKSRIPRPNLFALNKSSPDLRTIGKSSKVEEIFPEMKEKKQPLRTKDDLQVGNRAMKVNKVADRHKRNIDTYKARPQIDENKNKAEKSKILKGVRTNRRFDLQMKFRNLNTENE